LGHIVEALAGGPVIVIFHTRTESVRLYSGFVEQFLRRGVAVDAKITEHELDVEAPGLGTDVVLRPREGDPGTGSTTLPRKAV
jgi:hypothetical protein